jgi:ribosomal protein L13
MTSARNASAILANCRVWHHVDATDMVFGRLATRIAHVLQGKHKPTYHPAGDVGDYVVVTSVDKCHFTGRREYDKKYYWHTRFPGGLRTVSSKGVRQMRESIMGIPGEGASQLLVHAVKGMLPRNHLRKLRLGRLKCFNGPDHCYGPNILRLYVPGPSVTV